MKGLAAVLVKQKAPLELVDVETPPVRMGQVLVKVICSGICGAQIGEIDGVKGPDKFLPHLLGHEATGTVLEVGEGVRSVKPGDRVVLHWRKGAGLESVAPVYGSQLGPVNAGWVTTFQEYTIVSENRVTPIPSDFNPEVAALFGCAVTTAFGVINNNAHLRIGESIVIFGSGGVGLSLVQGAVLAGANPIVAIDLFDNRLELARQLGATHTLNSKNVDVAAEVERIVGKAGADVTVDNTGNVKVIELAYKLTNARGRTILVGVPPKGTAASIYTLPLHFEQRMFGSHGGDARPDADIPRYVRLVQSGRLRLDQLITRRYTLPQINQAIDDLRSGALAGRAMIGMSSN